MQQNNNSSRLIYLENSRYEGYNSEVLASDAFYLLEKCLYPKLLD
jgi:hypothetical protein